MLKDKQAFSSYSVDDIEKAKQFYGQTLGLVVADRPEGLDLGLSGSKVFVYPKPNHEPASFTVLNFVVGNIDEVVEQLTSKEVAFERYDNEYMKTDAKGVVRNDGQQPGPKAMAWFKDPAGNVLALIQEK